MSNKQRDDKFVWQPGDLVVVKPAPKAPTIPPVPPRKQGEKP